MTQTQKELMDRMAKWDAERKHGLMVARAELLAELRALGVRGVSAEYDGYGDSGNIEGLVMQPEAVALEPYSETRLSDFLWGMAYHQNPGFENNEGAFGEIKWDLKSDKINVTHNARYTETNTTYHEGL